MAKLAVDATLVCLVGRTGAGADATVGTMLPEATKRKRHQTFC